MQPVVSLGVALRGTEYNLHQASKKTRQDCISINPHHDHSHELQVNPVQTHVVPQWVALRQGPCVLGCTAGRFDARQHCKMNEILSTWDCRTWPQCQPNSFKIKCTKDLEETDISFYAKQTDEMGCNVEYKKPNKIY